MNIFRRMIRLEGMAARNARPQADPEKSRQVQEWLNLPLPEQCTDLEFEQAKQLIRQGKQALRIDRTDGRKFEEFRAFAKSLHAKYGTHTG